MQKKSNKDLRILILAILFLIGITSSWFYYFMTKENKTFEENQLSYPDTDRRVNLDLSNNDSNCQDNTSGTCVNSNDEIYPDNSTNSTSGSSNDTKSVTSLKSATSSKSTPSPKPSSTSSSNPSPTPSPTEDVDISFVREGSVYRMQSDSINSVGGLTSSTLYSLNDTVGEVGPGQSNAGSLGVNAGFQHMQEFTLSLSVTQTLVVLSGQIYSILGGTLTGSTVFNVLTDQPGGYSLYLKDDSNPAFKKSDDSFADYTDSTSGTPDYSWGVGSGAAEFGFSAKGADITSKFLDNGSTSCNTGSSQTADKCWYPFALGDVMVSHKESANQPSGTDTTLNFKAESKKYLRPGGYEAHITATAFTN